VLVARTDDSDVRDGSRWARPVVTERAAAAESQGAPRSTGRAPFIWLAFACQQCTGGRVGSVVGVHLSMQGARSEACARTTTGVPFNSRI
jgi:hypothetical protein